MHLFLRVRRVAMQLMISRNPNTGSFLELRAFGRMLTYSRGHRVLKDGFSYKHWRF